MHDYLYSVSLGLLYYLYSVSLGLLYIFVVISPGFLSFVFSVLAKRLAGKSISEMTYFVSSVM